MGCHKLMFILQPCANQICISYGAGKNKRPPEYFPSMFSHLQRTPQNRTRGLFYYDKSI